MAQFVQLQKHHKDFLEAGISVVALTYDSPDLQQAFVTKNSIAYPFLSDIDAQTVKALGILNDTKSEGSASYGIPYPGIFVVNAKLEIVGKIFIQGYQQRVDAEAVLAYAKSLL
ncbi:MAG: peroxiredoxin [Halioglobus sp.]|jgi:peroxiredoxin